MPANFSPDSVLVQKFGGTSIGSARKITRVAKIIEQQSLNVKKLIVVVSAISKDDKRQGTTSNLMQAAKMAVSKNDYLPYLENIRELHMNLVKKCLQDDDLLAMAENFINQELLQIDNFLGAVSVIGEISSLISDRIISVGEKLSAGILYYILKSKKLPVEYISLDSIVEKGFTQVDRVFNNILKDNIFNRINQFSGNIVVLTGFIGHVPNGILKGIGRGYTDFTAAVTAAAFNAAELQIWKEVDGVYSADPYKVAQAYLIDFLTPEEAVEITYYGAEVIHPFTIEQVLAADIPVRIKNSLKSESAGTVIKAEAGSFKTSSKPTAVTTKENIQVINIKSNRMLMSHGFMSEVFNILKKYKIIIDLISTSEVSISLTTEDSVDIMNAVLELKKIGSVSVDKNMAILSLVGRGMNRTLGTAAKMFQTLADNNINIEMISQGSSEINISCVVRNEDSLKALRAVHNAMLE